MEKEPFLLLQATLNGIELEIRQGSVINLHTDTIVNAANEKLEHTAGLAGQISKLAGPQLDYESQEYIRRYGLLKPGKIAATTAGNLRFRQILHTVGPHTGNANYIDRDNLVSAVYEAIIYANQQGLSSIGIPGISCGIFGFPISDAAKCHIESFIIYTGNYIIRNPDSPLRKIVFSLWKEDEAMNFLDTVLEKHNIFDNIMYYGTLKEQGSGPNMGFCQVCNDIIENPDRFMNICTMVNCCRDVCNFCIFQQCLYNCPIHNTRFTNEVIDGIYKYIWCKICKECQFANEKACDCRQACRQCIYKLNQGGPNFKCICGANIPNERFYG